MTVNRGTRGVSTVGALVGVALLLSAASGGCPDDAARTTPVLLSIQVQGLGTVQRTGDGGAFDPGTPATLRAVPHAGWEFDHWEGDLGGTANPVTITMQAPMRVTAVFRSIMRCALTVQIVGAGRVDVSPDRATYDVGAVLQLTPRADQGYRFDHWEGALADNAVPATLVMSASLEVSAVFLPITTAARE